MTRGWKLWAAVGLAGSTLLAVFAVLAARETTTWVDAGVGLVGALALAVGWLQLAREDDAPGWVILAVWSAPLLFIPPLESGDAYAYAAQGWLVWNGVDPYLVPMSQAGPFAADVSPYWVHTTTVYPPLTLWLQAAVVGAGGGTYWTVVGMRALAVAGVVLMAVFIPQIADDVGADRRTAFWFAVLNPLTLTHFVGGAHNDALMVGLLTVAVWLARRPGGIVSSMVALGLSAGIKQAAVLAGPGIAWYALRGRRVLALIVGGVIGGATFAALTWASGWGLGWFNDTAGKPGQVISHSVLSWVRFPVVELLGAHEQAVDAVVQGVSLLMIVAALVWAVRRWGDRDPLRVGVVGLGAFALAGTAMQPWYLLWVAPLFAVRSWSARVWQWVLAGVVCISVSGVVQVYGPPPLAVGIGIVAAAVGWSRCGRIGREIAQGE